VRANRPVNTDAPSAGFGRLLGGGHLELSAKGGSVGFISNQWLNRGEGRRNRGYHPVAVSITCHHPLTARTARKDDGKYQTVPPIAG